MKDLRAQTPEELGHKLKTLRESHGVTLEAIAAKTKISVCTLQALEAGTFSRLPGAVFARMFLRQYLAFLGEEPGSWLATFNFLWQKWESSSQPFPVVTVEEVKPKTWTRWVFGFFLVCLAVAVVFWLEKRESTEVAEIAPTPRALLQQLAPTPPPTPTAPEPPTQPHAPANGLVLATRRDCWVEWAVGGKLLVRQLLPAGQQLTLEVTETGGELLLGDAGAVFLRFRDLELSPPGQDGQVLRLSVPWTTQQQEKTP
ncbi:MAG: RodZ domain-containing protein [Thermoanaerobaculum sp.]